MKETVELFEQTIMLKEFDDKSLEELVTLRRNLDRFIKQVQVAKRDGYYFETNSETPSYIKQREKSYDEIFADGEGINSDCLSISSSTEEKVYTLNRNVKKITKKENHQ